MSKKIEFKHISVHEEPEKSPGLLLWQVSTAWRSSIENILQPIGLTHPQFVVLATLGWLTRHGDRVTQAAVGKMAELDKNTISQIIRGLENKKLIERVISSDVRAKNPLLTNEGIMLLKQALPMVEKADAQFFKVLTTEQKDMMIILFNNLIAK